MNTSLLNMFQVLLLVEIYHQYFTAAGMNGLTDDQLNTRVNRHASSAVFFALLLFNVSFNEVKLKGVRTLLYILLF